MTYHEEKYQRRLKSMTDSALEHEYKQYHAELMPEMALIMLQELKQRSLLVEEVGGIDQSEAFIGEDVIQERVKLLMNSKCPVCKSDGQIVCYDVKNMISFVFGNTLVEEVRIRCQSCAKNDLWNSSLSTAALGWWSIKGLFVTPWVLYQNIRESKSGFKDTSDQLRLLAIAELRTEKKVSS